MDKVAVLGAGGLGTAIAQLATNNVGEVQLYARREAVVDEIIETGYNSQYYPSVKLSSRINPTSSLDEIDADLIFVCVPSSGVGGVLSKLKDSVEDQTIFVSTSKGIEYPSLRTMSKIIHDKTGSDPVVFSGPNFASEIILNLPTITVLASKNQKNLEKVEEAIRTEDFHIVKSRDVTGVELCGVLKNINAIAYGICEGMKINQNAKYALLNRGFNETRNIIEAVGGDPETVNNYCGFGDIVLTSTSSESRNHTLGLLYGQGIIVDEMSSGVLFEGKKSVRAVKKLCEMNQVDSLVTNFAYDVLNLQKSPKVAFRRLWENMIQ